MRVISLYHMNTIWIQWENNTQDSDWPRCSIMTSAPLLLVTLSIWVFFFPGCTTRFAGSLVLRLGMEPRLLAVRVQSPNHWSTREPSILYTWLRMRGEKWASLWLTWEQSGFTAANLPRRQKKLCSLSLWSLIVYLGWGRIWSGHGVLLLT